MKLKVGGGAGLLRLTDKHCLIDTVSPTGGVDGLGLCTLPKSRSGPNRSVGVLKLDASMPNYANKSIKSLVHSQCLSKAELAT